MISEIITGICAASGVEQHCPRCSLAAICGRCPDDSGELEGSG